MLDFQSTQNLNLKVRRFWEILNQRAGYTIGLFQWLVTWPPDPMDPFVIPGWMARGAETHPSQYGFVKELEIAFQTGEIESLLAQGPDASLPVLARWCRGYLEGGLRFRSAREMAWLFLDDVVTSSSEETAYAAKRRIQLLLNGDLLLDLYRRHRPDCAAAVLYGTDNLAHKFWQYRFPEDFGHDREQTAPFRDLLTSYYRDADRLLGELLALLDERATVAVVSDHGFTSFPGLERGSAVQHNVPREIELKPRMERLMRVAGLEDRVTVSNVATHGYLTPRGATEEENKEWVRQAAAFLDSVTTAEKKTAVFALHVAPTGQLEVEVNGKAYEDRSQVLETCRGSFPFEELVEVEERAGNHSRYGILLLRGPRIRAGHRIDNATLEDVAPTLLHLAGQPIGEDMTGKVLEDAIRPEQRRPIVRLPSYDTLIEIPRDPGKTGDPGALEKSLSALGYVK